LGPNAIANLYKMPIWNKKKFPAQFGLVENDDVTPITDIDIAYDAPSDWVMLVDYSFGPADSSIETKSKLNWYLKTDEEAIKKLWQPTDTYYDDFVDCTSDKLKIDNTT